MRDFFKAILGDTSGATAIEYGLILAMVFLAMIGAVRGVGGNTIAMWDDVSDQIDTAINGGS